MNDVIKITQIWDIWRNCKLYVQLCIGHNQSTMGMMKLWINQFNGKLIHNWIIHVSNFTTGMKDPLWWRHVTMDSHAMVQITKPIWQSPQKNKKQSRKYLKWLVWNYCVKKSEKLKNLKIKTFLTWNWHKSVWVWVWGWNGEKWKQVKIKIKLN